MFDEVATESTKRLNDSKQILLYLNSLEGVNDSKVFKGIFFVLLYGALEYTISHCVQQCINEINNTSTNYTALKTTLYALIFDSECTAIMNARDKKWQKRYELFSLISKDETRVINDTLFPCTIGNMKYNQLESIWKTFGITEPIVQDLSLKSRLSELTDNRNKIAHGRETASDVGRNYDNTRLENIYNEISGYCSYVIDVFRNYVNNQKYLKNE